jgi:hypothetical protein
MRSIFEEFSHKALDEIAEHLERCEEFATEEELKGAGVAKVDLFVTGLTLKRIAREIRRLDMERVLESLKKEKAPGAGVKESLLGEELK